MNNVIIVTYDISSDSERTRFSKFLETYGVRIQFSVYEIRNSQRILEIVVNAIENRFKKNFDPSDSVYIFRANHADTIRFGTASLVDQPLILI